MNAQLKETEATEISLLPEHALDNPAELFTRTRLDEVIEQIRAAVKIVPDLTTEEGRKLIASTAYKVARSKTAIDAVGKGMVEDWKKQAKVIDGLRKHSWDTLETLQADVRKPLTEWETEQKRIEQEAIEAARIRREAEIAEREAKVAAAEKAEADRLAKIESDRLQAERDETIRADAERAAAAKIEQARQDAIDAEARREREAVAAQQAAHDAAIKAEADKAEAVRRAEALAAQQAAAREQARLAVEAEQREADEKRAANVKHRAAINRKALAALVENNVDEAEGKRILGLIANGKIPAVSIAY